MNENRSGREPGIHRQIVMSQPSTNFNPLTERGKTIISKPHTNFNSIIETAKITGLSASYLRGRLKKDRKLLPGFYVGNRYYVDLNKLLQLLEAEEEGCGQE